ncbi:PREDICTED: uncharacterized protein LOC106811565 [Priapulus caudatus]|uniref:Uncharacterized protein LOC106811565 n=1 Tax=Priapulus caudatus TaxID=37621 RepID=A0ABM1EEV0_PRICU|nr:PREDICTED: uncharacterized protein LOC106811565 [Priapulus caudatus]
MRWTLKTWRSAYSGHKRKLLSPKVTSVSDEGERQGILRGFDIEGDTVTVEIVTGTSAKMLTMTWELFDMLGNEEDIIHGLDKMEVTFPASKSEIVKIREVTDHEKGSK